MGEDENALTVFISYAVQDRDIAVSIGEALEERGVNARYDVAVPVGDSILAEIYNLISASDYIIILLSPHTFSSKWTTFELSTALGKEMAVRGITILPVLIADVEIPDFLQEYQLFDCRGDVQKGLERLVEQISAVPEIDFSRLDWRTFEDMVVELMEGLGFRHIQRSVMLENREFDVIAEYYNSDPFEVVRKELWIGEFKHYRTSRADIKTIDEFLFKLSLIPNAHGFLVVSNQITSVANSFLEQRKHRAGRDLRVIDGTELKRLLIKHKEVAEKYFRSVT